MKTNPNHSAYFSIDTATTCKDRDTGDLESYFYGENGLTKREHFAALAMQGMLANSRLRVALCVGNPTNNNDLCNRACALADELINVLNETAKNE